jgi:hypothetical protein
VHNIRPTVLLLIAYMFAQSLWIQPVNAQRPAKEVNLQEYVAELRSASEALAVTNTDTIHNVRVSLPSEWVVQTDGQSMRVKTDWLSGALSLAEHPSASSDDRLRQARLRLGALRESAEALLAQSGGANLDQSRAQLDRILSDREYQGSHDPSWLDKLKARVNAWIARQWEKYFGRIGISETTGSAIAWTLISLAGLLVTVWVVRYLMAAAARAEMDLRGAIPAGQDWRFWIGQARAAAERGDYRAAIHASYWAAVARLEENHLLPEDRSRTPRESLRLVKRGSAAYSPLEQLTRRFELTWYGYHTATSADWDDAMRQLETLGCQRSSTPATADS